ncbi:hypothetical protein HDU96_001109 [Phlyctochytrium bullatum]|nr:hypothetical protein HDU96_001109 [Phlyctochytrium bullatum]
MDSGDPSSVTSPPAGMAPPPSLQFLQQTTSSTPPTDPPTNTPSSQPPTDPQKLPRRSSTTKKGHLSSRDPLPPATVTLPASTPATTSSGSTIYTDSDFDGTPASMAPVPAPPSYAQATAHHIPSVEATSEDDAALSRQRAALLNQQRAMLQQQEAMARQEASRAMQQRAAERAAAAGYADRAAAAAAAASDFHLRQQWEHQQQQPQPPQQQPLPQGFGTPSLGLGFTRNLTPFAQFRSPLAPPRPPVQPSYGVDANLTGVPPGAGHPFFPVGPPPPQGPGTPRGLQNPTGQPDATTPLLAGTGPRPQFVMRFGLTLKSPLKKKGYSILLLFVLSFFIVLFTVFLPWTGDVPLFVLPGDVKLLTFDTRYIDEVTFRAAPIPTDMDLHVLTSPPPLTTFLHLDNFIGNFSFLEPVASTPSSVAAALAASVGSNTAAPKKLTAFMEQALDPHTHFRGTKAWVFPFNEGKGAKLEFAYSLSDDLVKSDTAIAVFLVGGSSMVDSLPSVIGRWVSRNIARDIGQQGVITLTPTASDYHIFGLVAISPTHETPATTPTPETASLPLSQFVLSITTPVHTRPKTPPTCRLSKTGSLSRSGSKSPSPQQVCTLTLPATTKAHILAIDTARSPRPVDFASLRDAKGDPDLTTVAGACSPHGRREIYGPLWTLAVFVVGTLSLCVVTTCFCGVSPGWVMARVRGRAPREVPRAFEGATVRALPRSLAWWEEQQQRGVWGPQWGQQQQRAGSQVAVGPNGGVLYQAVPGGEVQRVQPLVQGVPPQQQGVRRG